MGKHRHWKEITVTHHKLANYGQIFGHDSQEKKKQFILTHLKEFTSLKKSAFYLARKYYLALFGIFSYS